MPLSCFGLSPLKDSKAVTVKLWQSGWYRGVFIVPEAYLASGRFCIIPLGMCVYINLYKVLFEGVSDMLDIKITKTTCPKEKPQD